MDSVDSFIDAYLFYKNIQTIAVVVSVAVGVGLLFSMASGAGGNPAVKPSEAAAAHSVH
jgi:hypothetical protein